MEIPVIIKNARIFNNNFALLSACLNQYSEKYNKELEELTIKYVNKKYNSITITAIVNDSVENLHNAQFVFIGEFKDHPKYGPQFNADFYYKDLPSTRDGLYALLLTLPNIKAMRSKAIIDKFGIEGTIDVLDNDIEKLLDINGVTEKRLSAIKKSWEDNKYMREIYEFFVSSNLSVKLANAAYKIWNKNTIDVLTENPYNLAKLKGVGFLTADKEAHNILKEVPQNLRLKSCMEYVIREYCGKGGHLCIPYKDFKYNIITTIQSCDESLKNKTNVKDINSLIPKILKENLHFFTALKDLENNSTYIYLKSIWSKEKYIADSICLRKSYEVKKTDIKDDDFLELEDELSKFYNTNIVLDGCQKEAIKTVFENKVSIITGPGGSGKSMICRCICQLAAKNKRTIKMMSPTGKAAQVLESKTGQVATTIHRGLKMLPDEEYPREKIYEDILLIDEVSMCGIDTIYALFKAIESNIYGNIVFIGDKNQLPSVSPGNFLFDFLYSDCANVVTLDKIHRQSEGSYISLLANKISSGEQVFIPKDAVDINWHDIDDDYFYNELITFIDNYIKENNINNLQIISPMKKGVCGVFKINEKIQQKMTNINNTEEDFIQIGFQKFHVGDRVIQTSNNYDKMIFNGDMGTIVELGEKVLDISVNDKKQKYVIVSYYGDDIIYKDDEIEQISLAWCITVHKFQGSQSPDIVFIMSSEAQIMMSKELVYTAFTRAEKQLDIFGDKSMLKVAPSRSYVKKRHTNFSKIIEDIRKDKSKIKIL